MYDQRTHGGARADQSQQFGLDWARRVVRRHQSGLPVNKEELRLAQSIVKGRG